MLIGDNQTTKKIDNYAINELQIPSIVLMENASISFLKNINLELDKYLIICGKGNNGGDGYAIARQLYSLGKNVKIFCIDNKNMSRDCEINYNICKKLGLKIYYISNVLSNLLLETDCIIDSIFGTGLNSQIEGEYYEIIEKINKYSKDKIVYSVDIPSGINGDNGEILGIAVKSNKTITFMTYKKGFFNNKNREYFGEIVVENIGLNEKDFTFVNDFYINKEYIKSLHKKREIDTHKGDFGKVLIFSGSEGFNGASVIVTNSCVRTGAGLVTLLSYDDVLKTVRQNLLEAMTISLSNEYVDEIDKLAKNCDVIAIGCGIGKSFTSLKVMKKLLSYTKNNKNEEIKFVIDADGLNLIAENKELLEKIKGRAILTPHLVEFSRISGYSTDEILENKFEIVKKYAKDNEIILLLKGNNTIITDGENLFVNSTGNPSMANGGMGDSLTGIITALAGQKYSLLESANIGAYLHGYIADKLSQNQYIVNASHIIENISISLKEIFS